MGVCSGRFPPEHNVNVRGAEPPSQPPPRINPEFGLVIFGHLSGVAGLTMVKLGIGNPGDYKPQITGGIGLLYSAPAPARARCIFPIPGQSGFDS